MVWLTVLLLGLFAGLAVWFRTRPKEGLDLRPGAGEPRASRKEQIEVGGVKRPITDVRHVDRNRPGAASTDVALEVDYGRTPPVPRDANPNVRSVAEALDTGDFPERLTPLQSPRPFDQGAYLANPQAYLDVVEPGRVWQSAQPGANVPRIESLSPRLSRIEQGQSVLLKAKTVPGAPVTFTSFDLGAFDNQLTSITVRAGDDGIARATFSGTPGTYNDVNILAASPMTSGQLKFVVNVQLPRQPRPNAP
jgi:hypothetical protein